ncbi:MAG: CHAT domain-containing protein [Myxococcota bacterium]
MRVGGYIAAVAALLTSACAHDALEPLAKPEFGQPRAGVFNTPQPLVENTEDDMMPTLAGATGLIAYVSKQGGNLDVFMRSQATGLVRRLTTHSSDDTDPAFSPDGKRIAWVAQSDDVKGDVWIMNVDGEDKTQLTERDASESAPAWSADGKVVYFTTRPGDGSPARIDAIELSGRKRSVVLTGAWDPAPSPDGETIVYAAAGTTGTPRLYAKRLADGRVAAITDGVYLDALPRFATLDGQPTVVFTRFVDDSSGDGRVASDDEASLWATIIDPTVFESGRVADARPLTPGAGGELLAAVAPNWLAYTAAGYADLEIYALPADGMVERRATPAAVLEAARAEPDAALRRLALRHITATSPELRGRARYELGRDLEERGKLAEARTELAHAVEELVGDPLQGVAAIEIERVAVLQLLGGRFDSGAPPPARSLDEAAQAMHAAAKVYAAGSPVEDRLATTLAELQLARGKYAAALASFETIAARPEVATEDGARALDHASRLYARFADAAAVERVCAMLLTRYGGERLYVERCASTWLDAAKASAAENPTAAVEDIARRYEKLPPVAAPAMNVLGLEQAAHGHPSLAIASWQELVRKYPTATRTVADALIALGETAEREGERGVALQAYEQLLSQYGNDPKTRGRARAGVTRIALAKADKEEEEGRVEEARSSYARLLDRRRDNALAHRRYIALSARLGKADEVIASYKAAAKARPREAVSRFAYGYALTFASPLELSPAEREIGAALDLDPRFAAAHLTMGWLRMQREQRSPGRDWLDRAESSFRTALELVDPEEDPQLWAAAQLNRANALLGLGKNDDAFTGFLARNGASARFDDTLTQLLFFESFSRAAWRMDELDVALDMAHQEWLLAKALPGQPRLATAAALQASVYLQAERGEEAVAWYERAEKIYREREDWTRVVPMLRGKALALRKLHRDDAALDAFADLLDLTSRGIGVPEPDKPFLGFLAPEIAANPTNVTRAPYGFSAEQEEEVARAAAARALRERGDLSRARSFATRRLALIDKAAEDETTASRIQPELLHALNESALIEAQAGDATQAMTLWNRALGICQTNGYVTELVTILESLGTLWAREPKSRDEQLATRARALANAMTQQARETSATTALRLSRWLALERFGALFTAGGEVPGPVNLGARLESLDAMNGELDAILELVPEDLQLTDSIRAYAGVAQEAAAATDEFVGPPMSISDSTAASWRTAFDGAVASRGKLDAAKLGPAIDSYETYGGGRNAPERRAFLDAATVALIAAGNTEKAWRLLERSRLEDLDPGPRRRAAVAGRLAKRPILARALEHKPATIAEVRAALAEGETLLQVFVTHERAWTWILIDAKRLEAVRTGPMTETGLPDAVATLLGTPETTVYVDFGGHSAPPVERLTSQGKVLARPVAALSASYLAAGFESASLATHGPVTFTEPTMTRLAAEAKGRLLLRFSTAITSEQPSPGWSGPAQLTFAKPATAPESEAVDLNRLSTLALQSAVAWIDAPAPSPRVTRSLAQAFLLAGVSTVVVGKMDGARLETELGTEAASTLLAAAREAGQLDGNAYVVGYRGLSFPERVDLAFVRLLALARSAAPAYQAAAKSQRREDWQRAHDDFAALVEIVELLLTPEAVPVLAASKRQGASALAKALPTRVLEMRDKLAQTKLALGEVDAAAAIQEALAESYIAAGNHAAALEQLLAMGKTFMNGDRNRDAERVLNRCAELALTQKLPLIEGDCRSRLGSAYRGLFENEKARAAYTKAIEVYAAQKHKNQLYPRRFLGLLYETALNDYDEALSQYQRALTDAVNLSEPEMVPTLHLDMARAQRARGDFGMALEAVAHAREALPKNDTTDRTEVALEAAKIEWYRGDYPAALGQQSTALTLARANRNDFQEIQALSLGGLIAMNRGDLGTARESVSAALDLARGSGRRREEAAQLNNLGTVLQRAGRLDDAESRFREALELDTQLNGTEGQAFDLRALAAVLERRGKAEESLATVDRALQISRAIGSRYNEAQCLFVRGRALLAAGRRDEASQSFTAAHDLAVQLSIPEIDWRASYAAGRIAEGGGDVKRARTAYDAALAVAERLSRAGDEDSVEESRDTLYADAVRLALADHDDAAAFTLIERRHARALLDLVAASDVVFPSDEARQLVAAERRAREAVIAAERDQKRLGGDDTKVRAGSTAHAAALAALHNRYPGVARAFTIAPRSIAEVQGALRDDTAVVLYLVGVRQTNALVIRKTSLTPMALAIQPSDLKQVCDAYREALRAFGVLDALGEQISQAVLAPLGEALRGAQHVVFVPHGPLVGIPFAALPWQSAQVVDAMTTSYAPSASALVDTLSRPQRPPAKRVSAAAHGADLPFARLEARAVAGSGAILGPAASETVVRALRGDAVDIAAHGAVAGSEPMRAGLELAQGENDDGRLTLREVFGMPPLAPLVTLSACTLGGSDSAWAAVASSFFASGTQTLVASQERVSDLAAGVLMKRFYRERGKGGAAALRAAQLWTRAYFEHPAHWATFALLGDFR